MYTKSSHTREHNFRSKYNMELAKRKELPTVEGIDGVHRVLINVLKATKRDGNEVNKITATKAGSKI